MKINLFVIISLIIAVRSPAQDVRPVCRKINELNTAILNNTISKTAALKTFSQLMFKLNEELPVDDNISWVFPLRGYNYHAIGDNGSGYNDKGYHYLDGNKHAAHPAHDIFINDRNQDDMDDKTHQPVDVLSVADGVVIACTNEWESASELRGGRFIWIYHPSLHLFTYYAHNRAIFVQPGDMVKQGQKIAEVGRTGFNAYKKRSPTHLHFSAFHLINGLPIPYNPYQQLIKAKSL